MRISEMDPKDRDALTFGYVAPEVLDIKGDLKLHRDAEEDIDPFTFEVIRHSLFNVNEEHGATITHHHAVGRLHREWYERQVPAPVHAALVAAKRSLDPAGILNPGALIS